MRDFILFSKKGRTKADWTDLMKAGRIDIVCHSVIASLFYSNGVRQDTKLHVILNGPPDPPKHIEFSYHPESTLSKKDIATLIKIALRKYKPKQKREAHPGVWVEKKSFQELIKELADRPIYLLDKRGKPINQIEIKENPIFVLGDHEGLPKAEKTFAKRYIEDTINIGPLPYFTSQSISFINVLLDGMKNEKTN